MHGMGSAAVLVAAFAAVAAAAVYAAVKLYSAGSGGRPARRSDPGRDGPGEQDQPAFAGGTSGEPGEWSGPGDE
jgi:hypothetical protein